MVERRTIPWFHAGAPVLGTRNVRPCRWLEGVGGSGMAPFDHPARAFAGQLV
jgi:hypothetical protein